MIKCLNNKIILTILAGLFLSISLNFYFINKFNNLDQLDSKEYEHQMIKSDPAKFWRQAYNLRIDIEDKKNFFQTGYEYRISYLPSKILYIYSIFFNEKFYEHEDKIVVDSFIGIDDLKEKKIKISLDNKKLIYLILQSLIYYFSLLYLYSKVKKNFEKEYVFYLIIFLCFEPSIIMFHSSFWSESIFFSILIFSLAMMVDKNFSIKKSIFLGIVIGLLFLQRSVAIYYILIVSIYYFLILPKNNYYKILLMFFGYMIVLLFLGYHNLSRSSVFQVKPTQAMDGFYVYMVPNILAEKKLKPVSDIVTELENESKNWILENKIDFNLENDKIKYYKYLEDKSFKVIKSNLYLSFKFIIERTIHYLIFDPLRHVYYFYKYSLDEQDGFTKTQEHKNNIPYRIIYSTFLYLLSVIGLYQLYKEKKNYNLFILLILSLFYFISVSSWIGNNRYNVPNLIFLSFLIGKGFFYLKNKFFFKKND